MTETHLGSLLLVDDDFNNCDMLSRRLVKNGYQVVTANDGNTALELINGSNAFDLVLLDVMMPGMNGDDVLGHIREKYDQNQLPVIMVSAKAGAEEMVEYISLHGANDYVTKPVDIQLLLARAKNQIELKRSQDSKQDSIKDLEKMVDIRTAELNMVIDLLDKDRERANHLLSSSPSVIYTKKLQSEMGFTYISDNLKALSGYQADEMMEDPFMLHRIIHPEDDKAFNQTQFDDNQERQTVYRIRHKDDSWRWILDHCKLVKDKNKNHEIIGAWTDITDQKNMEEQLLSSEQRFEAFYNNVPTILYTLNKTGRILSINEYGAEYLGYKTADLNNIHVLELFHPDDRQQASIYLQNVRKEKNKVVHAEFRMINQSDNEFWVRLTAKTLDEPGGEALTMLSCEDITEPRRMAEDLEYKASFDELTGLVNRQEFEKCLYMLLTRLERDDAEHVLCYMDLDQFKVINDTYGHAAGDDLLVQLSQAIKDVVRSRDTLARLGGDEFGLLMEYCTITQAKRAIDAVQNAVNDFRFIWEGKTFAINMSCGLVSIDKNSKTAAEIMSIADSACYAAKESGGNRVHIYSRSDDEFKTRRDEMGWIEQVNRALEHDRLYLYYQPIVPIKPDCHHKHHELLVRMKDDNDKIIPAGLFLPAAERYGLAGKIDRWVIQTAFSWLQSVPEFVSLNEPLGINLSGQSLGDDEFLQFVISEMQNKEISPESIYFEITETAAIRNLTNAIRFITVLRDKGTRFALDDFGSGLSSFAYLKNLPVDYLKIDGAFVKNIVDNVIDASMVKAINDVGQIMEMQTIAEFVEDEHIMQKLESIGVDFAQGYGIGQPRPITELA